MLRRAALLLLPLLACTPRPRATPPRSVDASVPALVVTAPASGASAAEPTPPAPAAVPLPAPIPGTDPERVRLAGSLCAASYMRSPTSKQLEVGCVWHPPFERPEQRPNGRLTEHTGEPEAFCALGPVFKGAFSRPGAKEALVGFSQCKESEDAVWDMGFPGSAVLVEEVGDRFRQIGYRDRLNLSPECKRAKRGDGHEVLVCRSGLLAGASELGYVFVVDFARPEPATTLARFFSLVFSCMSADALPSGFVRTAVADLAIVDANHDGVADIVVTATRSRIPPSATLSARVVAACGRNQQSALPFPLPAATRTNLVFLADEAGYSPDAATARTLATWEAEDPPGHGGLDEIAP